MLRGFLLIAVTAALRIQPWVCTKLVQVKRLIVMVDLRSPWQDLELPLGLPEEMSKLTEVQRLVLNMGGIIAWVLGF